jgi:hypothetical protein
MLPLPSYSRVVDGDLNLDTRLDADGGDLLHDLRRRVKVDQALVDAHLEAVVGVGTLTARRLARGDAERLGRQTDRALHLEALLLGTADQVSADLSERHSRTPEVSDERASVRSVHSGSRANRVRLNASTATHLLEVLDAARGQRDPNAVDLGLLLHLLRRIHLE